jgi:translation initiation factor 3 subunit I
MSVTTTSSRAGKFESRFWHKLFEEEVGRVKGHLWVVISILAGPVFVHVIIIILFDPHLTFTPSRHSQLTISGPINTLAVHPQGKAYASGAEDGFVRVHWVSYFAPLRLLVLLLAFACLTVLS